MTKDLIEVYADYHTPTVVFARRGDDWFVVPSTADGWTNRRPWAPAAAVVRNLVTDANRVTFFGDPRLAELGYGIPSAEVAVVRYETTADEARV